MSECCREPLLLFFSTLGQKPSGTVYLPRIHRKAVFNGMDEMLFHMAGLLKEAARIKEWPNKVGNWCWPTEGHEALLNISIEILKEENHTWQGILKVVELKQSAIFRSALELLELLVEAIDEQSMSVEQVQRYWHESQG